MLKTGILNPQINALLARVRHTNLLVVADRGFPYWPTIETVDLALVDDIPTVLQVLAAIRPNFDISQIYMTEEFRAEKNVQTLAQFEQATKGIPLPFEPHIQFKTRVPQAVGLIRSGDTSQYANMILVSGRIEN